MKNMKKPGSKPPQMAPTSTTNPTDTTVEKMLDKEFRNFRVKIFNELKDVGMN